MPAVRARVLYGHPGRNRVRRVRHWDGGASAGLLCLCAVRCRLV